MLQLRPDLSFCFIAERAVLLDLRADRYFLLTGEPLRLLRKAMRGEYGTSNPAEFANFGCGPLFVDGPSGVAPVEAATPGRSALECGRAPLDWPSVGHVFGAQVRASVTLRTCGLRRTVARWRAARPSGQPREEVGATIMLSQYYAAKRALVPLHRSCVPDSLGLIRLLWRHGLDADLLFGVRLDPFAAHCWVQSESHVLSDPLSNVTDFTPVFRL